MGEIITVTSGRGGAGKSLVSAVLAESLAQNGKKTAIVDLCFGFKAQDYIFSVSDRIVYDISDECQHNCKDFESGISTGLRLTLFPASNLRFDEIDKNGFLEFIKLLKQCFDYIIVDVSEKDREAVSFAKDFSDMMIFVATPDLLSAKSIASLASEYYKDNLPQRLIINKLPQTPSELKDFSDLDEFIDLCCVRLIGTIPEVTGTKLSDILSLNEKSHIKLAAANIAKRICGLDIPLMFG